MARLEARPGIDVTTPKKPGRPKLTDGRHTVTISLPGPIYRRLAQEMGRRTTAAGKPIGISAVIRSVLDEHLPA